MTHAVRFDRYGDIDVLNVVDVSRPVPGPRQVLVRVKASSINPGEAARPALTLVWLFEPLVMTYPAPVLGLLIRS